MSKNWFNDISDLHTKFEIRPPCFNGEFLRFRQKFIEEEVIELDKAIIDNDPEAFVDALIDICVVAIGTLEAGRVDGQKAWDEVHRANMSKIKGNNPTRENSGGCDLIKPEGWIPPNHQGNTGLIGSAIEGTHVRNIGFESSFGFNIPSHIKTLDSYREHALAKTHDYDDDTDPDFQHFGYYPNGIRDVMYEITKKVRRINHGLKRFFNGGPPPKTDSLSDSFRDVSIYSAIGDTILQGKLEGMTEDRDIFNRPITTK
jgi:predicted HAD superfamily Cof-like phosphohydrolase